MRSMTMSLETKDSNSSLLGYMAAWYRRPMADAAAMRRAMSKERTYISVRLRLVGRPLVDS
jgi:hypothetical protein